MALGPARHRRIVYVLPGWQARPLMYYDPALGVMPPSDLVTEVITITYNGPRPRPGPRHAVDRVDDRGGR